ncbi:MAG: outer rane efflux protein [Pseudomonadota bacterium]|jgi:outer membrane protein TolC
MTKLILIPLLFLILTTLSPAIVRASPMPLTIQDVIEMALSKGLYHKDVTLTFQKAELSLLQVNANFDTQMYLKGQKEDSRIEAIGGLNNDRDLNNSLGFGLSRRFSTGSQLGIDYSYLHRESDLGAFMRQTAAIPIQYYHLTSLTFKQDLLNNIFGYRDRRSFDAAEKQYQRSDLERDEASEDIVLQAIKIYLDAYAAQENLKQSLAARDKYILLVKSVKQKSSMGFDDKSELTKTKAELQTQERNVKSASLQYLNLIERLYTVINATAPEEVTIALPEIIPSPMAVSQSPTIEDLRKSKSMVLQIEAAQAEKEAAANNRMANLLLTSQATYSGLDKSDSVALSEMNHREHPKYSVGLELIMRWGGSAQKAESLSKKVAFEEALNNQAKLRNDLVEALDRTQRNLQSKYIIAVNAQETVRLWEEAVKNQEKNHRFGRITTAELIIDYGTYFRAKSSLSAALADYQLSIYEYQATRDELVKSKN